MLVRKPLGRLGEDDSEDDSGFDWGELFSSVVSAGGSVASAIINNKTATSPLASQTLQAKTTYATQTLQAKTNTTNLMLIGGIALLGVVLLVGKK